MDSVQRSAISRQQSAFGVKRALFRVLVLAALLALTGCDEGIDTTYGRRTGMLGGKSVNGTNVFAQMILDAGHQVRTKRYLTDNLKEDSDVIVWFPDDFSEPTEEQIAWLNEWLWWEDGRTLIYVGRDFDAGPLYFDKVIPGAPADQVPELKNRRLTVQSLHDVRRGLLTGTPECNWFTINTAAKKRSVTTLAGPYSDGIDASKVEIELHSRLDANVYYPTEDSYSGYNIYDEDDREWRNFVEDEEERELLDVDSPNVLLKSNNDILISRQVHESSVDGQLILVANGSFLLNMPLVNHEHRKLAQKLIDELGNDQKSVVFLESGPGGPEIMPEEPSQEFPTGFAILTKRPLDIILFHLAVLGIVFCLSRWPIFGRERRADKTAASDFGRHVDALGELIERTGDQQFAQSRLRNYQQNQRESD